MRKPPLLSYGHDDLVCKVHGRDVGADAVDEAGGLSVACWEGGGGRCDGLRGREGEGEGREGDLDWHLGAGLRRDVLQVAVRYSTPKWLWLCVYSQASLTDRSVLRGAAQLMGLLKGARLGRRLILEQVWLRHQGNNLVLS